MIIINNARLSIETTQHMIEKPISMYEPIPAEQEFILTYKSQYLRIWDIGWSIEFERTIGGSWLCTLIRMNDSEFKVGKFYDLIHYDDHKIIMDSND